MVLIRTWLAKPTPQPSKTLPMMSIARFTAAAFNTVPTKKKQPAINMVSLLPKFLVVHDAKNVAVKPAKYKDDVNNCNPWLSYLQ